MKLSKIRSGVAKAEAGAWVRNLPIDGLDDVALKVRGALNDDALRVRAALIAELPEEKRDPLSPEDQLRIGVEMAVEAILIDWTIEGEDDKPLPFTKEKARELLTDPDIGKVLQKAVAYASRVVASQGVADIEAAAKN